MIKHTIRVSTKKRLTMALLVAVAPLTWVSKAHSSFPDWGNTTLVGLAISVTLLGCTAVWKGISENKKTARLEQDKTSITTLSSCNPTEEFYELNTILKSGNLTPQDLIDQFVINKLAVDDYFNRVTRYKQDIEQKEQKLKTNISHWEGQADRARLRDMAQKLLQSGEFQSKKRLIASLYNLLQSSDTRAIIHLHQTYDQVINRDNATITRSYRHLAQFAQLQRDYNMVKKALDRCSQLGQTVGPKQQQARFLLTNIEQEKNRLEQSNAYQTQLKEKRKFGLKKQQLRIAQQEADARTHDAQTRAKELSIKQNNYEDTIWQLNRECDNLRRLLSEKQGEVKHLHYNIGALKSQLHNTTLEKTEKDQLEREIQRLKNTIAKEKGFSKQLQRKLKKLTELQEKVKRLKREANNPPFSPESPEFAAWIKKRVDAINTEKGGD